MKLDLASGVDVELKYNDNRFDWKKNGYVTEVF